MNLTADDVKRRPYTWEQRLLSAARVDGGQEAVDRMAERIADYNTRALARARRAAVAPWPEAMRLRKVSEEDYRSLYAPEPECGST